MEKFKVNEFIDVFKAYIKHLKNVMLNGGFIFIMGFLFIFLPFIFFASKHWIALAIIWLLLSSPFIVGFLVYYFTDYKENKFKKVNVRYDKKDTLIVNCVIDVSKNLTSKHKFKDKLKKWLELNSWDYYDVVVDDGKCENSI